MVMMVDSSISDITTATKINMLDCDNKMGETESVGIVGKN